MIVQLNERALFDLGFDRAGVEALRHFLRQVGDVIGAETLPSVAARAGLDTAFDDSHADRAQIAARIDAFTEAAEAQAGQAAAIATLTARVEELQEQLEQRSVADIAELSKAMRAIDFDRPTDMRPINDLAKQIALIPDYSAALAEAKKVLSTHGTMATQNANAVAITGGTLAGMTSYAGGTGSFTSLGASGQITSTLASGTAPLVIASTTKVVNLNVDQVDGGDWASPGALGTTAPNSAAVTTLAASGLVDFSAAGAGQIKFPATQNPSADVNTLDDYEEGTFTPVVTGTTAAGAGTYSLQTGSYVKVGRLVTFNLALAWSAHTGTGNLTVTAIPFSSATNAPPCSITAYDLAFTGQLAAYVNGTTISLWQLVGGAAFTAVAMDGAVTELRISGQFFV